VQKCLIFILIMLLSSSASAQTLPRFDEAATKRAVSAAAAKTRMSRGDRIMAGIIIGAGAGMLAGYLYWQAVHDCDICEPGPAGSLATFGLLGAGIGASIGAMGRSSPDRRRDIPLGRHVTAAPAVSPSRLGATVTVAF
jgi:hypothetical protein